MHARLHHLHTQHHSSTIVSRGLTTLYPSPTDNENPTFIDPEHKPLISPSNKSATRLTIREHTPWQTFSQTSALQRLRFVQKRYGQNLKFVTETRFANAINTLLIGFMDTRRGD